MWKRSSGGRERRRDGEGAEAEVEGGFAVRSWDDSIMRYVRMPRSFWSIVLRCGESRHSLSEKIMNGGNGELVRYRSISYYCCCLQGQPLDQPATYNAA